MSDYSDSGSELCVCLVAGGDEYGKLWDGGSPGAPSASTITHQTRVTYDSFVFHKVLGKGSFGKVSVSRTSALSLILHSLPHI